jgi:tellurite resistance protein TerC
MANSNYVTFEIVSMVVLTLILLADVLLIFKRPHIPSAKESTLWVLFYAALAVVFGVVLWQLFGAQKSTEFFAGWLTEYSLSIDNLFVFVIIMTRFAVPKKYQQEVLMVGVVLALILRGIFILVGAALIESFSAIFYIFGAFLLYTAWHQAFRSHDDEEESESKLIVWLRKRVEVSEDYDGAKIRTVVNGKKMFTPMLVVFIAIAATDVMFAFDSIPAIFGITQDPFIVFTANVFALMGLRQLYFLLQGAMDRLIHLGRGLSFILAFIGVKMIMHALHENGVKVPDISLEVSLTVIISALSITALTSLYATREAVRPTKE